jgi:hypothetical protein
MKQIIEFCMIFVNQAYKLTSISDRFYVLLIAFTKMVSCSLCELMDGNESFIFNLYELPWFVALWNETPVDVIPGQYKEELAITLIEACLQVREDLADDL